MPLDLSFSFYAFQFASLNYSFLKHKRHYLKGKCYLNCAKCLFTVIIMNSHLNYTVGPAPYQRAAHWDDS